VIIVLDIEQADTDLLAGALTCPRCSAALRPWSSAATRRIRWLDGSYHPVRPRRARCSGCRATQVLLPAWCLPRRADAAEVIGAALVAKAGGQGHRAIARDLGRPVSTVRRWLRGARGDQVEWLRRQGVLRTFELDQDLLADLVPQVTALGDALCALAAAVLAWRRRFARSVEVWTLIGAFTGGRLLAPP
jgi:transposase-like protein